MLLALRAMLEAARDGSSDVKREPHGAIPGVCDRLCAASAGCSTSIVAVTVEGGIGGDRGCLARSSTEARPSPSELLDPAFVVRGCHPDRLTG